MWSAEFRDVALRAFNPHMGVEHMSPLIYSLVRFVKPVRVLEVGAGATTLFILKALADNAAEAAAFKATDGASAGPHALRTDSGYAMATKLQGARLHCLDTLEHAHTSAHTAVDASSKLGLLLFLRLHVADALTWQYDPAAEAADDAVANPTAFSAAAATAATADTGDDDDGLFDMIWLDFGLGEAADDFVASWWPRVRPVRAVQARP